MLNITYTGFADEISTSLDEQIATLKKLGMDHLELRSVEKVNIADFTLDFAKEVKAKLDNNGIKVSALGSPCGKIKIYEDFEPHFEKFKHVVELAKFFETKYIRIFSFYIDEEQDPEQYFGEVVARLKRFIEYAKANNVVLLHENEKDIYGDTYERCVKLFKELYCESFRCTYDPANFVQCGCDTVNAFDALKTYIEYLHIKDARFSDGLVVPPGYGDGNIPVLIKRLSDMNYTGFLSLEPHLKSFSGLDALENGAVLVNKDSNFKDGPTAFTFAHDRLVEIVSEIK